MMGQRIVIDTNVYVSRFLRPDSIPGQAVARVWVEAQPLTSIAAWTDLQIVLSRPKFARYIQSNAIEPFLNHAWAISETVMISTAVRACRDPRDDKFLEIAVHGRADTIITGDGDLLALHLFQGIAILTPAAYLESR
jgi:putative PIN family toxin of toxin-antitoxin system